MSSTDAVWLAEVLQLFVFRSPSVRIPSFACFRTDQRCLNTLLFHKCSRHTHCSAKHFQPGIPVSFCAWLVWTWNGLVEEVVRRLWEHSTFWLDSQSSWYSSEELSWALWNQDCWTIPVPNSNWTWLRAKQFKDLFLCSYVFCYSSFLSAFPSPTIWFSSARLVETWEAAVTGWSLLFNSSQFTSSLLQSYSTLPPPLQISF